MQKNLAAALVPLLFVVACSERSPTNGNGNGNGNGHTTRDAAYWTAEGWVRYEDGRFKDATTAFLNAIDKDSLYAEAVAGKAWADLEQGFTGLSFTQFEEAIAMDSARVDPYYGAAYMAHAQGLALPNQARQRFEQTVSLALKGLERGGDSWSFTHNTSVNAVSIRVLLARAYYGLARYDDAEAIVDLLDPGNSVTSSSSTYLQDLLLAIESLEDLIP